MNKLLLISIPLLFCVPDSTKVDTIQKPIKMFFKQRSTEQITKDINFKLDLLLAKLQAKNDTINLK